MVIAVNTSFTPGNFLADSFIFESFSRLAQQYPQHQFLYIFDTAFDKKYITSKNITCITVTPKTKNPVLLQYRLNFKLPSLLRKYKVDVLIHTEGYCSLRTKVPQCAILNNLSFLQHPEFFAGNWLRFYKKNTIKYLSTAKHILTTSQFLKKEVAGEYKISVSKIDVAYQCASDYFKPVTGQQKDKCKEIYSQVKEYFLYSGSIEPNKNLMALLKAFSFFKKRQKSNMLLVIASNTCAADKEFIKSLSSFKYRNEVKLLENLPVTTMALITASAYAMVYSSVFESLSESVLEAMQSDVPVIASNTNTIAEICNDAVLYINPNDFNDIADKMMLLFKDENKRNELIIMGRQRAGLYSLAKTVDCIWESIIKCTD